MATLAAGAGAGATSVGAATEGPPRTVGIGSSFGGDAATADAGDGPLGLTADATWGAEAGAFGADAGGDGVTTGADATADAARAAGGAT